VLNLKLFQNATQIAGRAGIHDFIRHRLDWFCDCIIQTREKIVDLVDTAHFRSFLHWFVERLQHCSQFVQVIVFNSVCNCAHF
jgi:hypothetical protein